MNIGRTTLVVFVSKLLSAVLGFVATVYFARHLGAEVLGIYSVIIAFLAWLKMGGRVGVNQAMIKRISEGDEEGEYLAAGTILIVSLLCVLFIALLLFRNPIKQYVGDFSTYSSVSVVWFIAIILTLSLLLVPVKVTLHGQGSVHIAGVLNPTQVASQSILQILLVFLGYSLVGMLIGYGLGILTAAIIGLLFVSIRPKRPERRHFRSLLKYAKFSWLSGLKSRAYNDVDILVLGAFVSQTFVGIYAVAWSLTRFLDMFGIAISQSMFPEISNISAQESRDAVTGLIEDSIAYAGFIVIPGSIGGFILSDRLLQIYSDEFTQGTEVLWFLLLSLLFYAYLQQHLNALNAINRPDLAFRINLVFISANIGLNLVLIWQLGWTGAALASTISAGVGLLIAYAILTNILTLTYPTGEISRQVIAAIAMGGVVWILQLTFERTGVIQHNFVLVVLLVGIGVVVYTGLLLIISARFRKTVRRNLPERVIAKLTL